METIPLGTDAKKFALLKKNPSGVPGEKLTNTENVLNDFNNIIVMCGTAKRKTGKKQNPSGIKPMIEKSNFLESFSKLRAPFYKSHQKLAQSEEKIMTKSCETLLECIKPYKIIQTKQKIERSYGTILKTSDVVYERKATRKVQFFTFSEEDSNVFFNDEEFKPEILNKEQYDLENVCLTESGSTNQKTKSSEDFITDVFRDSTTNGGAAAAIFKSFH